MCVCMCVCVCGVCVIVSRVHNVSLCVFVFVYESLGGDNVACAA